MESIESAALAKFRENVQRAMKRQSVTVTEMADALGMGRPSLSRVLNGHESPTITRAEKIAQYLEVPLKKLFS